MTSCVFAPPCPNSIAGGSRASKPPLYGTGHAYISHLEVPFFLYANRFSFCALTRVTLLSVLMPQWWCVQNTRHKRHLPFSKISFRPVTSITPLITPALLRAPASQRLLRRVVKGTLDFIHLACELYFPLCTFARLHFRRSPSVLQPSTNIIYSLAK